MIAVFAWVLIFIIRLRFPWNKSVADIFIRAKQVAAKRQPVELQVGNVCENLLIPLPRNRFFHCKIRKNE